MSNMPLAEHLHTVQSHNTDVNGLCFSTSALATCSGDKTVRLWSTEDFAELPISPLCGHTYVVYKCQFSPFGTTLASCSMDGSIILWNVKTGEQSAVLRHPSNTSIRVCKFSPNSSMLVSGSDDNSLCLWEVSSGKLTKTLTGHEESVVACDFSPDGNYLASGSPAGDIRIWDGQYGHGKCLLLELDAHDLGVTCCEFSPTYVQGPNSSGTTQTAHYVLVTAGQDDAIRIWELVADVGSLNMRLTLRDTLLGHTGPIMCIAFGRQGALLASGSGDKTVRLWDAAKGECLQVMEAHSRYVTCCAFSQDGKLLASGSNDRTVMVWRVTTETDLSDAATDGNLVDLSEEVVFEKTPMERWSVEEVGVWLEHIGLPQYKETMSSNAIDGTELLTLTHSTLEKPLGIVALGHRNKILRAVKQIHSCPVRQRKDSDLSAPDEYLCPITREIMRDPVIAADGYTYEKSAIESWVKSGKSRSPMTNAVLASYMLTPNRSLKMLIQRHVHEGH
ncbi:WD repeat, SAM and U-box domain-containing protein 1-like [Liolophura sinensis]|uniref:WD repeat, SAM and U-box domain-containing protein 1-like n=1 Tax=Liolophura sinensis TaxID=3198878 RepID=UPI0031593F48